MSKHIKRRALLLRVGMDSGYGKRGTVTIEGKFHWISLPNHPDPTWDELSYGDKRFKHKRPACKIFQFKDLKPKDLLVFYAGLDCEGEEGAYIIGYYVVKMLYDFINQNLSELEMKRMHETLSKKYCNPHVKRIVQLNSTTEEILIIGRSGGLLRTAIKIGSSVLKQGLKGSTARLEMDPDYFYIGYEGDLTQAGVGHWIDYEKSRELLKDKELRDF